MICLKCGYCCFKYDVIIVDDPKKEITKKNLKHKPSGVRCQHLKGNKSGKYKCKIHNEGWYKETPCFRYEQIGKESDPCRMGKFILRKK